MLLCHSGILFMVFSANAGSLQEYYDAEDMLFFLYVRSVLQQELDVGFRTRWAELGSRTKDKSSPAALFLTQKECMQVCCLGGFNNQFKLLW